MKRVLMLLLALCLLCTAAVAEEAAPLATANATVISATTTQITAPYAGTLLTFDLAQGDRVSAGDTLMALDTQKIYASQSGTLQAVFAEPGDDAEGIQQRYGALAVIEPENALYISATTRDAYNDDENRYLHAGEILYLKLGDTEGTGRVTSVTDSGYVVEILTGSFEVGDKVQCFRDADHSTKKKVGSGTVCRYPDVQLTGAGRVLAVHKHAGEQVQAGDLIMELTPSACPPTVTSGEVISPVDGAVSALYVSSGAQVYQGQLLCEIQDLTQLELSAQVDEVYLSWVKVGDTLTFTLDAYADREYTGQVTEILPLGVEMQNATYYEVRLTISNAQDLLPGMSGTLYIS